MPGWLIIMGCMPPGFWGPPPRLFWFDNCPGCAYGYCINYLYLFNPRLSSLLIIRHSLIVLVGIPKVHHWPEALIAWLSIVDTIILAAHWNSALVGTKSGSQPHTLLRDGIHSRPKKHSVLGDYAYMQSLGFGVVSFWVGESVVSLNRIGFLSNGSALGTYFWSMGAQHEFSLFTGEEAMLITLHVFCQAILFQQLLSYWETWELGGLLSSRCTTLGSNATLLYWVARISINLDFHFLLHLLIAFLSLSSFPFPWVLPHSSMRQGILKIGKSRG